MISFFGILGLGITIAILSQVLKSAKWDYGNVLSVIGGVVLLVWVLGSVSQVFDLVSRIGIDLGTASPYLDNVIKALGLSIVTKLAVDCCRDMGESAVATNLELCGRLAILATISPLIMAVVNIVATGVGL